MDLSSNVVGNVITFIFFVGIATCFILYRASEIRLTADYIKQLEAWKSLASGLRSADQLSSDQAGQYETLRNLDKKAKELIRRHFILTSQSSDEPIPQYRHGSFVLANPIAYALPNQPTSPYRFVPALLTTIGVAGTFLGITYGLADFNTKGTSDQMIASAANLLAGMKTAFYTSLGGLGSGAVFMLLLSTQQKQRAREYQDCYSELDELAISHSATTLLHGLQPENQERLAEQQLKAAESMNRTNEQLANTIGTLGASLQELSADNLANTISGAIEKVVQDELAPPMAKIPEVIEDLKPIQASLDEMLKNFTSEQIAEHLTSAVGEVVKSEIKPPLEQLPVAITELKQIKEDQGQQLIELLTSAIRDEIVQPVMAQTQTVSDSVNQTTQSVDLLSQNVNNMIERLTETTGTLNEFQRDTLTKLQDFAESLKEILTQFKDDTEGTLDRVGTEINNALATAIEGMTLQREAFETSATKAAEAFVEQNATLSKVGEETSALMSDAKTNLLEGLGGIDEKVKLMSDAVQTELERFRIEYQDNLTSFFKQQETLLEETLGAQREGLAGVVSDFRSAFEDEFEKRKEQYAVIGKIHEDLSETIKTVQELMEAVGWTNSAIFNQLETTAKTVGVQASKLELAYEKAQTTFSTIMEKLPEEMNNYFTTAKANNEKFFDNFDEAAFEVHSKLAQAANLLVTAMQQIETQRANTSGLIES